MKVFYTCANAKGWAGSLNRTQAGTRSAQLLTVTRAPVAAAPLLAISFALLWSYGDLSAANPAESSFELVLAKSNRVAPPPHRALRRLAGGLNSEGRRGWLEAWTEYQPGRGFTFEV